MEIGFIAIVFVYLWRRDPFKEKFSDELARRLPREFATTHDPKTASAVRFARGAAATAYKSFPFDLRADEANVYLTPPSAYLVRHGGMNYAIPREKIHDPMQRDRETTFSAGGMHIVLHQYSGVPLARALALPLHELSAAVPPPAPLAPLPPISPSLIAPLLIACLLMVLGGSLVIATGRVAVGAGFIVGSVGLAVLGSRLVNKLRRAVGRRRRSGSSPSLGISTVLLALPYLIFGWVLLLFGSGDAIFGFLAGVAFSLPIGLVATMLTLHRIVMAVPEARKTS